MMIPERPSLERRVLSALDGSAGGGTRIPVVLGGCGTGRTSLLLRLRDLIGRSSAQYVDVNGSRRHQSVSSSRCAESSPFPPGPFGRPGGRSGHADAFDADARVPRHRAGIRRRPATFLLDEFLELRTFESFPGLRSVLRDLLAALSSSGNRFVLPRAPARAHRLLRDAPLSSKSSRWRR